MIEKERLEELTQNGETIYTLDTKMYSCEEWLPLENRLENLEFNKYGQVKLFRADNGWWHWFNLKDLYEDLQWMIEFGCIERTERLELPTWEELFDFDKATRFLDCYTQEFAITKQRSVIGVVLFGVDFTNKIIEVSIGSDKLFVEELTKENYIKACRKAKELFLGENSDD